MVNINKAPKANIFALGPMLTPKIALKHEKLHPEKLSEVSHRQGETALPKSPVTGHHFQVWG